MSIPAIERIPISFTASADLKTAVTGRGIQVVNIVLLTDGDCTLTFKSGSDAITGAIPVPADGGFAPGEAPTFGHFETAKGEKLAVTMSGTANVGGYMVVRYTGNP